MLRCRDHAFRSSLTRLKRLDSQRRRPTRAAHLIGLDLDKISKTNCRCCEGPDFTHQNTSGSYSSRLS